VTDRLDPDTIRRVRTFRAVSTTSGVVAGLIAKRLIRRAYVAARGEDADSAFDPSSARFSWPNALLWALAAGIGLVTAKMVSDRVVAIGWRVATGASPPSVLEQAAVV
jgi:hypothetical protein